MAKMTPEEIDREVERITREIRYEGFMKSRTWKNIKLAKLEAVGWKCERCGRDVNDPVEISLDVHHKTYDVSAVTNAWTILKCYAGSAI